eukprot:4691741-Heterocapsa_arctica.AAC.1
MVMVPRKILEATTLGSAWISCPRTSCTTSSSTGSSSRQQVATFSSGAGVPARNPVAGAAAWLRTIGAGVWRKAAGPAGSVEAPRSSTGLTWRS